MDLFAFGEVLWDVYGNEKYIGGAPLNFAAHFVGCGGRAHLVSAIGNDALGIETKSTVENFGVLTDTLLSNDKPTGRCDVTLDEKGIPHYSLLSDVAYDYINTDMINTGDVLYFGTLAQRGEFNRKSLKSLIERNDFAEIFVDVNIRPPFYSKATLQFSFENATAIKISDEELPTVAKLINIEYESFEEFISVLHSNFRNLKTVIITCGDKGAFAWDFVKGESAFSPAEKVRVVSTVGAGDSFAASFLYNKLKGDSLDDCLKSAIRLSAFVVSCKDAVPR